MRTTPSPIKQGAIVLAVACLTLSAIALTRPATRILSSISSRFTAQAVTSSQKMVGERIKPRHISNAFMKSVASPIAVSPYTITVSSAPPSGSPVGQGQVITYTITITNNGGADATSGSGFIRSFTTSPTEVTFQFNPAFPNGVMTQPGAGSAWNCVISPNGNGTTQFTCYAGDGIGGASDTFSAGATVVLKVDALVSPSATADSTKNFTSFFETDLDGNGVDEVFVGSNNVSSKVAPPVDLAISKVARTATAPATDPQNSVIAGGTSVAMTSLASIGNEGRGNISYVLGISNIGSNNATDVVIQDSLPAGPAQLTGVNAAPQDFPVAGLVTGQPIIPSSLGVTAVSISDDTGGAPTGTATTFAIGCHSFAAGATLTCVPGNNTAINPAYTVGVLPAGFQAQIAYRIRVLPSATLNSIVTNSARITSTGSADINSGNNTSLTTQNLVITKVDLGITKVTSNATPVAGGAAFSYTLTVTNNNSAIGSSDARNIVVTDQLPPGIVFQNIAVVNVPSIAGYGLTCSGPASGTNGTVTCTGNLPGYDQGSSATSSSTITIVAQAIANLAGGVRTNVASVTSDTQEVSPNVAPNVASVQQNIQSNATLTLSKSGPANVAPGDTFTYHLGVTNSGSSSGINVVITDPLPADTTFLSLNGSGDLANACSHNGLTPGTVTCAIPFLATGTSGVDITVRLSTSTQAVNLKNIAQLSAAVGTINVGTAMTTATVLHPDLKITKTGPIVASAGQTITYTLGVSNIGPIDAQSVVIKDTLPNWVNFVSATTSDPGIVLITPAVGQTGTISGLKGLMTAGSAATITIVGKVDPATPPNTVITNTATITSSTFDPNAANDTASFDTTIDPLPPAASPDDMINDMGAGSILIFPVYTSSATNPTIENTRISITNTGEENSCIHLFAIDGLSCTQEDVYVCMTKNQTVTFEAADFDPGVTGYMLAIAVDCQTGLPKAYNSLIGSEFVKFASGHAANLGATAVSALLASPAGTNANATKADIRFDGVRYNRLPRIVSIDSIPSRMDNNSTMLILDSIGGDLTTGTTQLGALFGYLYDDAENSFSFSNNQPQCQSKLILSNTFPRLFNSFTNVVPAGRTGWMRLWLNNEAPLVGAVINYNPNLKSRLGFNQGHNLHYMSFVDSTVLTIPIAKPGCN